jgi:hypothetical protein
MPFPRQGDHLIEGFELACFSLMRAPFIWSLIVLPRLEVPQEDLHLIMGGNVSA